MAGELSFLTTPEVEVGVGVVVAAAVEGVVVVLVVLTWSVMSVVRLVISLVSAACVLVQEEEVEVEVQEDVVAAALDIAGAQAMVEGEFLKLIVPSIHMYLWCMYVICAWCVFVNSFSFHKVDLYLVLFKFFFGQITQEQEPQPSRTIPQAPQSITSWAQL